MVLSFGVVFFLLAKFGFPVIVKAINERKEFIEMSLLSAKQANERLASIQAESEKLLADAKAQQKDIISSVTGLTRNRMSFMYPPFPGTLDFTGFSEGSKAENQICSPHQFSPKSEVFFGGQMLR